MICELLAETAKSGDCAVTHSVGGGTIIVPPPRHERSRDQRVGSSLRLLITGGMGPHQWSGGTRDCLTQAQQTNPLVCWAGGGWGQEA